MTIITYKRRRQKQSCTQPSPKRSKITPQVEDGYLPGNITEIELHNFMNFSYLKCRPGPRLNLVIGPNGTGKSSLVCAIALGLGGDPHLLGRASTIGAYVMRGKNSGYIKISLKGNGEDDELIIKRTIDALNKSQWLLNGQVVPKKKVVEMVVKLNIQVENLMQFLPQDRVCEFAKLNPVELLEETEKAVGDPELPAQHLALGVKSRDLVYLERAVDSHVKTLTRLQACSAAQKRGVELVREKEQLLTKAESMRAKQRLLMHNMKKEECKEAKELATHAKKELDEAKKALNDVEAALEEAKQEKELQAAERKKIASLINDNGKRRMEVAEEETRLRVLVRGKDTEIKELRQEETREERILKAKEDLVAAELELENLPLYEIPEDELESLHAQILELEYSAHQKRLEMMENEKILAEKKGSLRQCMERLKHMEDKQYKLLQALRGSGVERIFEAYTWLEEHRHMLKKHVYGPVLLEVNVSSSVHANYLEAQVPSYMWKSFITQDPSDRDLLVRNMRSFNVPILNYIGDEGCPSTKLFDVSQEMLAALGIYSRLDQVFDAPNAVKEVLIRQCGLDRSYIGSEAANDNATELSKLGIMDFWTPENHYRWHVSRYGGHVSASVDGVARSRLLLTSGCDVGETELRRLLGELEGTISGLEESFKPLETEETHLKDKAAELHKQRERLLGQVHFEKRRRREMKTRVHQKQCKLKRIEDEDEEDLDICIANLVDQAAKYNIKRFQCVVEMKKLLLEAVLLGRSHAEQRLASIQLEAKVGELEFNFNKQKKCVLKALQQFKHRAKLAVDCRLELTRHAKVIPMITPQMEKGFLDMPSTVEDLEAAIQEKLYQANSIFLLNHNILKEHQDLQNKIKELAAKLDTAEKDRMKCLSEINALKGSWLPKLRNLVDQINETFSINFQEMAAAGEVLLDEHGMEFDRYGIIIKVKFRQAEAFRVLNARHQSGGERSVSTILYLLSLQHVTNCPFSMVDEINQGMDSINERKVLGQIMRTAARHPQCFLLTPKLLPDMEYSEACSVLNIINGPWMEQPSKLWSNGEAWSRNAGGLVV